MVVFFVGSGCAVKESQKTVHESEIHLHKYPFTKVMENYHVRLKVDHIKGRMQLIIEEISEKPVKLLRFRSLKGKITFPDNKVKTVTFRTLKPISQKWISRRKAGVYIVKAEWLKTVQDFVLEVMIHFKGQDYEFTFNYKAPGGR